MAVKQAELVIDLPADDGRMLAEVFGHLLDDPRAVHLHRFAVETAVSPNAGMIDAPVGEHRQNIRPQVGQPARRSIGRRSDHDGDAVFME
ncbi:hypothetical protein D1872_267420 [compost metagenome]